MKSKLLRVVTLSFILPSFMLVGVEVQANTVTTPCGTAVGHNHISPDYTSNEKQDIRDGLEASFPEATVTAEATKNYNCHSYAWAGSAEWINDPGVYIDSYGLDAMEGHQLTYLHCLTQSPSHSAVDCDPVNYKANSKWGDLCRMYHDWDYVLDGRPGYTDYGDVEAIYAPVTPCCGNNDDCEY